MRAERHQRRRLVEDIDQLAEDELPIQPPPPMAWALVAIAVTSAVVGWALVKCFTA